MVEQPRQAALLSPTRPTGRGSPPRVSDAVEAGHAGDHDHVASSGHQCRGGAEAQLVDLVVDAEILLNVGVGGRKIGLRLVVVVVGDEILNGIGREEAFELPVELRRQRLILALVSAGLWSLSMTLAIVKVFPDPVTPSSVTSLTPCPSASQSPFDSPRLIPRRLVCRFRSKFHWFTPFSATNVIPLRRSQK